MKIFLSHESERKPTVREFKKALHSSLTPCLDEEKLVWGDNFGKKLASTIQSDMDFLIIFLDDKALKSDWVRKELVWALKREIELERTFILPVLLPKPKLKRFPKWLKDRKYLTLEDWNSHSMSALAREANSQMFNLLIEEYHRADRFIIDSYPFVKDAVNDIEKYMLRARKQIQMVGVCLNFLRAPTDFDILKKRARSGVKVTLCLANPEADDIIMFREYLYPKPTTGSCPTKDSVVSVWDNITYGKGRKPKNVTVKLFDKISTYSILIFDEDVFIYPYGYQKLGDESPAFHFKYEKTNRSKFYLDIAKRIVEDSKSVNEHFIRSWRQQQSPSK